MPRPISTLSTHPITLVISRWSNIRVLKLKKTLLPLNLWADSPALYGHWAAPGPNRGVTHVRPRSATGAATAVQARGSRTSLEPPPGHPRRCCHQPAPAGRPAIRRHEPNQDPTPQGARQPRHVAGSSEAEGALRVLRWNVLSKAAPLPSSYTCSRPSPNRHRRRRRAYQADSASVRPHRPRRPH